MSEKFCRTPWTEDPVSRTSAYMRHWTEKGQRNSTHNLRAKLSVLFNWTVNGVSPCDSGSTIRHNTQKIQISHKIAQHIHIKHIPQSYTNNKGYIITHNTKQEKWSYHILYTIGYRRPIGVWDVEDSSLSRYSVHRWQLVCRPYAPAALFFSCVLFPSIELDIDSNLYYDIYLWYLY
jgi:hypothetical protein